MRGGKLVKIALLAVLLVAMGILISMRLSEEPVAESAAPSPPVSLSPVSEPPSDPPEAPSPGPYADKPEVDITSWELRLVNTDNLLSSDFIPEVTSVENGQYFDARAAEALGEFVAGAREAGLAVYVTSSYRSFATQEVLFNNKVNEYIGSQGSYEAAVAKARTIVAYPGSSEHQTGLAADIVDKYYEYMNESLADTELSKWMKANCARYGFILRFPEDKQDITGIMFEPWHFRYVGVEAATYIMENGLCLEEFVALYK